MSEELSGRELRIAALKAAGWKQEIDDVQESCWLLDPAGEMASDIWCKPEECWEDAPACESSIAAAWPLLEAVTKRGFFCRIYMDDEQFQIRLFSDQTGWLIAEEWNGSRETEMAAAICRALVAAAEETL